MAKAVSFYTPEGQKKQQALERQMLMAQMLMGAQKPQQQPTRIVTRDHWSTNAVPAISNALGMTMMMKGQKGQQELQAEQYAEVLRRMGAAAPGAQQGAPGSSPAGPTKSELNPYGIDPSVAAQAYMADPAKYAELLVGQKKPTDLQRNITAAGFTPEQTASAYGEALLPKPDKGTDDQREYRQAVDQGYKGTLEQWILSGKRAGATNVSVNTEKNLYGTMAEKQGAANVELYAQAQKAPELLQRAQRVKSALGPDSQAITGAGADFLLSGAKIAAQVGFNTGDAAADTEALARDLAASTLDQIKASGLGAGSGFSNADRDFLEKVVGGKITLEGKTLKRLADLNEKSALGTIQRWNATASRLKPEQLRDLGMSPIEMPAGTPAPAAKPKLQKKPDGTWVYSP